MTSDSRSVYLITYSHVDCEKVKCREDFAELFARACEEDIIKQWVCSCEKQSNGRIHYCLGIKLNRVHRWKIGKENQTINPRLKNQTLNLQNQNKRNEKNL